MTIHGYQSTYGEGVVAYDAHGKQSPIMRRLSDEFARLRAKCAADGLPDIEFSDVASFTRHIAKRFGGQFNAFDDPNLVVSFKDTSKGLALGNLRIVHGEA